MQTYLFVNNLFFVYLLIFFSIFRMPQVHNKAIAMENSVMGKNSRFMSTIRVSEGSKRKIRAFNTVETRLNRFRLNFYARHAEIQRYKRIRERDAVLETIKKRNAYRLVIKNHSVTNCKDYKKALEDRYTAHALRFEIRDMLKFMKPDRVRERNARERIEENRELYNKVIERNRESVRTLFPEEKQWRRKYYEDSEDEFESDSEDEKEEEEEKKKQEQPKPKAVLSFGRQGVTKAFVLQSGRTEVDIKLNKESKSPKPPKDPKPEYDLPPVVVKKQMDPNLQIPA